MSAKATSVYQYEQPRLPNGWNESERRFYNRLIQVLDDIYSRYGRIDEKMLSKTVVNKIENATELSLDKMVANIISAGTIAADSIEATFASMVSLSAKYGSFDFETVKNLVAEAMVLEKAQADKVHITNLAATYAQIVSATLGGLCLKASDGNYYTLDVGANGEVTATQTTVSSAEEMGGETDDGKVIVGTSISATDLTTQTLYGTQALLNTITAELINVETLIAKEGFAETLTANQAFLTALSTATISNDTNIQMLIGKYGELSKWFIFDDEQGFTIKKPAYTDASGIAHPESIWQFRATETGIQIIRSDMPTEPVLSAEREQITTPSMQIGEVLCKRTSSGGWVWTDV